MLLSHSQPKQRYGSKKPSGWTSSFRPVPDPAYGLRSCGFHPHKSPHRGYLWKGSGPLGEEGMNFTIREQSFILSENQFYKCFIAIIKELHALDDHFIRVYVWMLSSHHKWRGINCHWNGARNTSRKQWIHSMFLFPLWPWRYPPHVWGYMGWEYAGVRLEDEGGAREQLLHVTSLCKDPGDFWSAISTGVNTVRRNISLPHLHHKRLCTATRMKPRMARLLRTWSSSWVRWNFYNVCSKFSTPGIFSIRGKYASKLTTWHYSRDFRLPRVSDLQTFIGSSFPLNGFSFTFSRYLQEEMK